MSDEPKRWTPEEYIEWFEFNKKYSDKCNEVEKLRTQ